MLKKLRQKFIPILLGLFVVALAYWFETTPNYTIDLINDRLNSIVYDTRMRIDIAQHKPDQTSPVVLIDIDEKSLKKEGRWPWSRDKMASLLSILREKGVIIIAIDVIFSEPERNIADVIFEKDKSKIDDATKQSLMKIYPDFDNDQKFANAISNDDVVLGYVLTTNPEDAVGLLPEPVYTLSGMENNHALITEMSGYIAGIEKIESRTNAGGFVTTLTDDDGVIRHYPIVLRYKDGIYPSLGLATIMQYLLLDKPQLDFAQLPDGSLVLENIVLGNIVIPTDEKGDVLIPYQGYSRSYPYYSATDVLNRIIPAEALRNKIAFIGTSAIGLGDLHVSPFESTFPGVEIHATVADIILSKTFPVEPDWDMGALIFMIIFFGVTFSIIAPFLSVIWALITPLVIIGLLAYFNVWLWEYENIYISSVIVYFMMFLISLVNIGYGFLFEARKRTQMKEMFGQYVPPAHVDQMIESNVAYTFEGESRTMSVLFADIRNFTSFSEKLSPTDLKKLLNEYFTPMTQLIFDNNGTIDKYVGDMIMAFWGAPLDNPNHALDAVKSGFAMLKMADSMGEQFKHLGIDSIKIGIGVNTGPMNVGDMGSKYRRSYTVIGDSVNLGSRLEASTKFYHVNFIISEYTLAHLHNQVFVRHLDRVKVKGKDDAVNIFQPICMRNEASEALLEESHLHAAALKYYYDADWNKAMEAFKNLHERYPDVYIYEMFLKRIPKLIADCVETGWDGCFVRGEK